MPLERLRAAYSHHLGHECAVERFLVVGEGGLATTLRRVPHVVTVVQQREGEPLLLEPSLPRGTTKE
eukprot:6721457-Lingulodinium_polyedra.AAC.1